MSEKILFCNKLIFPAHSSSSLDLIDSSHASGRDLPPEVEQGNIEYKLKLIAPSAQRLQHLITQLKVKRNF